MEIKLIKTEKDYQKALKRLEILFDAKPHTKAGDELDILAFFIVSVCTEAENIRLII